MTESKHDKWLRLSRSRKAKIDYQLRLITNLRNKRNYEYTDEEANRLFDQIISSVNEAKDKYFENKRFSLN